MEEYDKHEIEVTEVDEDDGVKFDPYTATEAELKKTLDLVGVDYKESDTRDTLIDLYENAPRRS